ncbi:type II secretion system protein [Legionella sp. km772]|uniref:type II secretion system protein n=1 Tax=Legionella sp. km772 TaxID=2498111 RepID=UPI000F8E54B1|nr:type II secretion system protein [Legionella sp. km772]RUR04271.1 type II secretion system protein [Legionella sp. km772]
MRKEKGFILIFTLCIMTLVSLLALSSINNLRLYQRALTNREIEQENFYQLERIVRQLITTPKTQLKACTRKEKQQNTSREYWLGQGGCQVRIKKRNYRYFIEDLGFYPCLMVVHKQMLYASHHYLFTVIAAPTSELRSSLIQLRVIRIASPQRCSEPISYVHPGISSWRYLPNVEAGSPHEKF